MGAGVLLLGLNVQIHRWAPPPEPSAAATRLAGAASFRPTPAAAPLPRSVPVRVRIPAIGVNARVIPLGLDASGGQAVPPLDRPFLASWYDKGPAPGQDGPAVLAGHVDSARVGPAVFYNLGKLVPGNLVYVTREDRRTAVFRVTSVGLYPQHEFPSHRVYGPTPDPALRLVTCGGDFDTRTHLYLDRIIAFAVYATEGHLRP